MSEYTREKLVESMRWQASQVRGGYIHGNVNAETAKRMEAAAAMLEQDGKGKAEVEKLRAALRLCVAWMECGAQTRLSDSGERDRAERIRLAKESLRHDSEARP